MITSKQYDTLMRLNDEKETALKNLYTGSKELTDRAFDFVEANQEFERFVLSITEDKVQKESDGWIEWGGGKRPVDSTTLITVRFRNGEEHLSPVKHHYEWRHFNRWNDIVAYRVVKP